MVGFSESQQVAAISKVFADSYKSPVSVIVLDNIERLLGEDLFLSAVAFDWNFPRVGARRTTFLECCVAGIVGSFTKSATQGM